MKKSIIKHLLLKRALSGPDRRPGIRAVHVTLKPNVRFGCPNPTRMPGPDTWVMCSINQGRGGGPKFKTKSPWTKFLPAEIPLQIPFSPGQNTPDIIPSESG